MKTSSTVQNSKRPRVSSDERGFITFDFIFALMLALGFTSVLFALAVSLSAIEVAQYVVFASSRAYTGAHESKDEQEALGQKKYKQLMAVPILKAAFNGGWFSVTAPTFADFSSNYKAKTPAEQNTFIGAQMKIDAKLLRMQIPFLGMTSSQSTTGKATLNSYLMREVSNAECRDFNNQRFNNLIQLGAYKGATNTKPVLITDNGC